MKTAENGNSEICHSCGELCDENDRFCMKSDDKRRSALDSEGNNGLKESKRPKSLDECIKEKGIERRRVLNQSFCKMLINRVKATEKHQIHVLK